MAGEGIPEDLKERARMFAEWDDIHEQLTEWEIEQHRARPQVRRRNNMDDTEGFVVELVGRLRALVEEAREHGYMVHADLHAVSGSVFDGLAAWADRVDRLDELCIRVAKWDDGHGGSVFAFERGHAA